MYVKKNLLLWVAVFALALPLLLTGTASAKYMSDGAVQHPTNGGWITPSDGVCVLGLHADGTMDIDATITSKRDCDARLITGLTGTCNSPTLSGDGAAHANAGSSTCVTVDGSKNITGTISLKDADRTAAICQAKGGYLANNSTYVSQTQFASGKGCIAYGWQFAGQNPTTGAPLSFGAKGASQGTAGFCSAYMDTGIGAASCPSTSTNATTAFGYVVHGTLCDYQFGIVGNVDQNNTRTGWVAYKSITGTTQTGAKDLSTITTMGDCLAAGYNWNSWIPYGTTGAIGSITTAVTFDLTQVAVNADEGCLHCHSKNGAQYNGPAERWKDSYLKTGHKNMLRKVTAGMNWAGADGVVYTTDGTNAINFTTGTINVSGTDRTLYYVYGDWMAPLPSVIYSNLTGTTNGYSCYACHTTGASDNSNPGVQSIGTAGYSAAEPNASFGAGFGAKLNAANPKWDLNGIQCSRCHNATVPSVTAAMISGSTYTTTAPTNGGMGALAAGTGRTNLCFGCHQSIGKDWPAGTTSSDPTKIPVGVSHGAAPGRDFNGHVLGNSFLNSVHGKYNGTIKLNSLGKYDLTNPNGTSEYGSIFKGYTCWQTSTGNSPAAIKADGTEIKTKADCDALYACSKVGNADQTSCTTAGGAWVTTWRADQDGTNTAAGVQGTCTTCHDVHNSLFVVEQTEKAIRKTCENCHVNNALTGATDAAAPQVNVANIAHPKTAGTPFDTARFEDSCVVCHMGTQAEANGDQNSMPAHVWRINTNATYNTFPTVGQFYGGLCSVHTGSLVNAATSFVPAIYKSDTTSALCASNGGTWTAVAKDQNAQTAPDGTYTQAVWVDLDMACGQCHGGSGGSGATHNGAMYISKANLAEFATSIHDKPAAPPVAPNTAPTAAGSTSLAGWTVTLTDTSSDTETAQANLKVSINWGDGQVSVITAGTSTAHTYTRAKLFTIMQTATDKGDVNGANVKSNTKKYAPIFVPTRVNVGGAATTGTFISLKKNGHTVKATKAASGAYNFSNVLPGTYTIRAYLSTIGTTTVAPFAVVDTDVTVALP